MNDRPKPSWWLLDAMVITITLGLLVVHLVAPSPLVRQLLQVAAVGVGYWLLAIWLRTNSVALKAEEQQGRKAQAQRITEASEIDPPLNRRQKHFRYVMNFHKDRDSRGT